MKDSSPPQLLPKQRNNDIFRKIGTKKVSPLENYQETSKGQAIIKWKMNLDKSQLPGIIVTVKIVTDILGNLKDIDENKKDKIWKA